MNSISRGISVYWGLLSHPDASRRVEPYSTSVTPRLDNYSTSVKDLTMLLLLDAICELSLLTIVRHGASHQCTPLVTAINVDYSYSLDSQLLFAIYRTTSKASRCQAAAPQIKPRFNTWAEWAPEYVYVSRMSLRIRIYVSRMSLSHQASRQSQAFLRCWRIASRPYFAFWGVPNPPEPYFAS